ncbi:MAG: ATP-binding cassette domain-containing protein [Treponema sp.]|jgi:ABC-type lipoprotein export system ATPase subunit|nr:ATP-binding cassette domain-containing protein [Treponema sp.]
MATILELKNVSFSAQNQNIVQNLDCTFEEGKATALVGPSGCGKSTVLKLAAGILIPNQGVVEFRGRDIYKLSRRENLDFRRESAFVFQDSALWANQDLFHILELPLLVHFPDMSKSDRLTRIMEVVEEVGYRRDLYIRPANLSMGEQKLIAFARALICGPHIFFLDEWAESLDDKAAQHLTRLIAKRQKEQKTIIFITHDFRFIKSLADHIIMILGGKMFLKLTREQIDADRDLARYIEMGISS